MDSIYEKIQDKKFVSTLKETSVDKSNPQNIVYMTESLLPVINFDEVKNSYIRNLEVSEPPKSNDAIFICENGIEAFFVEFKNGEIDSMKNLDIKIKIYDSLLILLDLIDKNISFSRNNLHYILVYNENKIHTSKKFNNDEFKKVEKNQVRYSGFRDKIVGRIKYLGGKDYIQFDLKKFERMYFKTVNTFTKKQFEERFVTAMEK